MAILDEMYSASKRYFDSDSYLDWLESFIIDDKFIEMSGRSTYKKLLMTLWDIPFKGLIGNDNDRGREGLELRDRYQDDILVRKSGKGDFNTPDVRGIFGECRVLEMLVVLAMHMYTCMDHMHIYNSVSRWFWELIDNTNLHLFEDSMFDRLGGSKTVNRIVTDILEGRDNRYKIRGWFDDPEWDSIEIWYQMHRYLKRYLD